MNPDLLRGLGQSWHRLADSMDGLDPGGAVSMGAESLPGAATAEAMAGARALLDTGVARTAARFRSMAEAARHTADSTEASDADFAATLRRIDGGR
ncbi:hypothetical protein [Corynebacterium sp.]|uniref:hypothetical protein n=1 Tax=Corynebacterium sp. TaxID=1720 RepID=UPI0026E0ECC0|nr:hypothetical protein [Corynebacterium sp.]